MVYLPLTGSSDAPSASTSLRLAGTLNGPLTLTVERYEEALWLVPHNNGDVSCAHCGRFKPFPRHNPETCDGSGKDYCFHGHSEICRQDVSRMVGRLLDPDLLKPDPQLEIAPIAADRLERAVPR